MIELGQSLTQLPNSKVMQPTKSRPVENQESFSRRMDRAPVKNNAPKAAPVKSEPRQVQSAPIKESENTSVSENQKMIDFLNKMESDLGVPPESVVLAFSKLTPQELMQSPEESMDSFVEKLNLQPDQKIQAKKLFQNMIQSGSAAQESNSANAAVPVAAAQNSPAQGQDLNVNVMTEAQMRRQEVNKSIDELNNRFFVNPRAEKAEGQIQKASGLAAYQGQKLNPVQKLGSNPMAGSEIPIPQGMNTNVPTEAGNIQLPLPQQQQSMNQASESYMKAMDFSEPLSQTNDAEVAALVKDDVKVKASSQPSVNVSGLQSKDLMTVENTSLSQESQDFTQLGGQQLPNKGQVSMAKAAGGEAFVVPGMEGDADTAANVREIVNNAQLIAKKGGGEMRVKLTPEGLGELNLKVNMEGGKVNVEMITQSNEAKKVIEKGIADLKSNLALQKLSVDEIKVDVGNNTNNDLDLAKQEQEQERAYQERFLEEFRQENGAFRGGQFELPGVREVKSQTRDEADGDFKTSGQKKDSNRRLDLVA